MCLSTMNGSNNMPNIKTEEQELCGATRPDPMNPRSNMADHVIKTEGGRFHCGESMGEQIETDTPPGAKMAEQCLKAVLWQDMSVNLASTLLHQLSERASRTSLQTERTAPSTGTSPALKLNVEQTPSPASQLESGNTPGMEISDGTKNYFYRCHVCGFETEGRGLFHGHMTEHRQWERRSFSLHCCVCDHSANQETDMQAHTDTHTAGETHTPGDAHTPGDTPAMAGEMRCPFNPPTSSSVPVAMETQPQSAEHRCRICQRSFPGQQELLVHFKGHRQGNQYRCDRCGHLTRTANKLVEHVRVHTGERPFTCHLCPYSAKRRDSLRLHCKVKHGAQAAVHAPSTVHTHRSYVHGGGDSARGSKHTELLHKHAPASSPALHPSLTDLSPLLSITTLLL
ncbi:zinc finger protein 205-like [Gadus chalcogrammus]|uniref:zinc finger protein 205-like n=1 Tax=Gadus chalcogrammus TaxID=1042646 RepID=UPI0024C4BB72|nr:zinc finger protein 205-like [Gadus chalcogrammus]